MVDSGHLRAVPNFKILNKFNRSRFNYIKVNTIINLEIIKTLAINQYQN